jgi:DNA-binding NarL/FixJ family response regulator
MTVQDKRRGSVDLVPAGQKCERDMAKENKTGEPSQGRARRGMERKPIRTLVVCKSARLRKAVTRFLERGNAFEVVGNAENGYGAVRGVQDLRVDLVLMDVYMARMDGLEATRRIKERGSAPVVILCALDDSGHLRGVAKVAGADAFVPKAPKMWRALQAAIRRKFPRVRPA